MAKKKTIETKPTETKKPAARPSPIGDNTGRELPEAVIRPAQCPNPNCRSTKRAPFRDGPLSTSAVAVEVGGQLFNRQAWYNTACQDCGQRYRVIRYGYEPTAAALADCGDDGHHRPAETPVPDPLGENAGDAGTTAETAEARAEERKED
jgi:hypothetical protein